ncbi:MAG: hypothetical protein ASARMPRED_004759 [Alectoria sarmentosa]|nr:MAG: hypothetical protein ASARMPRED_004759 [Alectoria sarmentosa]
MEREASSSPSPLSPQTSSDRQDAADEPNESNQGAKGLGARGSSIENLQECKRFAKQSQICSIEDRNWTRIQLSYNILTETIKRNDGEFVLLVALRRTCSTNMSSDVDLTGELIERGLFTFISAGAVAPLIFAPGCALNSDTSKHSSGRNICQEERLRQQKPKQHISNPSDTMEINSPVSFNNTSLALPPTALQPRHLPFAPLIAWARAVERLGLILALPVVVALQCLACIALARLFKQILDNVVTIWANSPPYNQIVLEAGNMRIEFGCSGEPVPLEFVAEFAASHLDAVERGFAPAFAREWCLTFKMGHLSQSSAA